MQHNPLVLIHLVECPNGHCTSTWPAANPFLPFPVYLLSASSPRTTLCPDSSVSFPKPSLCSSLRRSGTVPPHVRAPPTLLGQLGQSASADHSSGRELVMVSLRRPQDLNDSST